MLVYITTLPEYITKRTPCEARSLKKVSFMNYAAFYFLKFLERLPSIPSYLFTLNQPFRLNQSIIPIVIKAIIPKTI